MSAVEQTFIDTGIISFWTAALFLVAQNCFIVGNWFAGENITKPVKLPHVLL